MSLFIKSSLDATSLEELTWLLGNRGLLSFELTRFEIQYRVVAEIRDSSMASGRW